MIESLLEMLRALWWFFLAIVVVVAVIMGWTSYHDRVHGDDCRVCNGGDR